MPSSLKSDPSLSALLSRLVLERGESSEGAPEGHLPSHLPPLLSSLRELRLSLSSTASEYASQLSSLSSALCSIGLLFEGVGRQFDNEQLSKVAWAYEDLGCAIADLAKRKKEEGDRWITLVEGVLGDALQQRKEAEKAQEPTPGWWGQEEAAIELVTAVP